MPQIDLARRRGLSLLLAMPGSLAYSKRAFAQAAPESTPAPRGTSVGMLPILEWPPTGGAAPFERQLSGRVAGPASLERPVFHSLGAVGMLIRSLSAEARQKLADALYYVDLAPQPTLTSALANEFTRLNVPVESVYQIAIAETVRKNDLSRVPDSVDAVLDVQINGAGYFPIGWGKGYSPMLYVSARLLSPRTPKPVLMSEAYGSDYRDAKGDPRFFTAPVEMIAKTVEEIAERGPSLKQGMQAIFSATATAIAKDVHDVVKART
jgi:hypothetical protein